MPLCTLNQVRRPISRASFHRSFTPQTDQRRIHGLKSGDNIHGEREARAYIVGLRALLPVGSTGNALGQVVRVRSPPAADEI
jgi:hypothetical protein